MKKFFEKKLKDTTFKQFQIIINCVKKLNSSNLYTTQALFIKLCHQYTEDEEDSTTDYGSIMKVFGNLFGKNFIDFNMEFLKSTSCTNKKCKLNQSPYSIIFGPFNLINLIDYNLNKERGIVNNWISSSFNGVVELTKRNIPILIVYKL